MTREERKLLLKDLCARLPYNPYISIKEDNIRTLLTSIEADQDGIIEIWYDGTPYSIEDTELYLRPMESMTEEEFDEYMRFIKHSWEGIDKEEDDYYIKVKDRDIYTDWLLSHHFDYRGLIEKGLAIKAPERMYKME